MTVARSLSRSISFAKSEWTSGGTGDGVVVDPRPELEHLVDEQVPAFPDLDRAREDRDVVEAQEEARHLLRRWLRRCAPREIPDGRPRGPAAGCSRASRAFRSPSGTPRRPTKRRVVGLVAAYRGSARGRARRPSGPSTSGTRRSRTTAGRPRTFSPEVPTATSATMTTRKRTTRIAIQRATGKGLRRSPSPRSDASTRSPSPSWTRGIIAGGAPREPRRC